MKITVALLLGAVLAASLTGLARASITVYSGSTELKVGVIAHYGLSTTEPILALSHQSCWPHLGTMSGYVEGEIGRKGLEAGRGRPDPYGSTPPSSRERYGIAFDLLPKQTGHCTLTFTDGVHTKHFEITVTH